jgi:hypothetical protein
MRYLCALFLSVLLAGCVAGGSTIDQSKAASLTHIQIVAVEGPPLSGTGISQVGLSGSELVVGGTTLGSNGLLIVGGVMMLADFPEANRQSAAASKSIESLLDEKEIWEPTLVIAEEAKRQLTAESNIPVSVDTALKQLPGVEKRDATFFMENWMAPLRSWYNESPSTFVYSDQSKSGAVLEVGLLNYELTSGSLLVQVVMKLIDPATGTVLANARNFSNTSVEDMDRLFQDDASGYKHLFQTVTAALVEDCIDDLGLH